MDILLIDVDSVIPNLALMKISAYHKSIGDNVGFNINDPDKIYVSIIFEKHKHWADGLKFYYPNADIDVGGSGYDLNKKLPDYIDNQTPDYDLYKECDRYYGFTTRGCIRNCYFCIVRKKEGNFKRLYNSANDALKSITGNDYERFDKIEFLDNNILADKEWFLELTEYLEYRPYKIDFNQGLDIRLVDDEIAQSLSKLSPINCWKFAFDDMGYRDHVKKGIAILNKNGVNVRTSVMFYVYCHDDQHFNDTLERCRLLKEWGATPYIMLNQNTKHTKRMKNLKRWCRPWIFWSIDYNDYRINNEIVEVG